MPRLLKPARKRPLAMLLAAAVALAALAGIAVARTFTLQIAKNATVINMGVVSHQNIVVSSRSRALYTLSGDSRTHPKCTKANGCFATWPPVKVSSTTGLSKAPGIKGKLGTWRRNGFIQLTLRGHPLYRYAGDTQKRVATGQGIHTFNGTWYVVKPSPPPPPPPGYGFY